MRCWVKNKNSITQSANLAVAAGLTALGILLNTVGQGPVQFTASALLLIATAITAIPIAKTAFTTLRYKVIGIDLLVTAAVLGAVFIGEYWEAAVVAVLFSLGHYLEARSISKTRSAIKSLLDQAPDVAWVERGNKVVELSPDEVRLSDIVVVKSGQKIPVDGEVVSGQASVNQATVTGESMPVDRTSGGYVYAGSIITSGYLRVTASRIGERTMFAQILEMVEEAQDKKARTQIFLERFASYYTPAIMALAIITYLVSGDMYLALTLLVIACPGALVIATPISIVAGIGNGARNGILIKGGESIENINASRVIAFDKTGTLTEGRPRVVFTKTFGVSEDELLGLAATAEYYSEHPLGASIVEYATEKTRLSPLAPQNTEVLTGLGIKALTGESIILVGNRQLMAKYGVELQGPAEEHLRTQEHNGKTAMLVARDRSLIGIISVADPIRPGANAMISQLRKANKTVVILSGDNTRTATAIATQLGIKEVYAELMPTDKVEHISRLQHKYGKVTMVGDGVNDAPALAVADASVAAGGAGKDIAMEVADIVLLSGDISKLSYALSLSRVTMRNVKANIYFAVGLVVVLLIGVLTKNIIMSFGMLLHVISVLLVIMNASRLLGYTSK